MDTLKFLTYVENGTIPLNASISNTILYSLQTDRQANNKPKDLDNVTFKIRYENPHVVGMGLAVRHFGRRKGLVNMLHAYNLTIGNTRYILVETANEVVRNMSENGYYLPKNTNKSKIIMFHLDNTDFLEDNVDGKDALLLVGCQYPTSSESSETMAPVEKTSSLKPLPNRFGDLEE